MKVEGMNQYRKKEKLCGHSYQTWQKMDTDEDTDRIVPNKKDIAILTYLLHK